MTPEGQVKTKLKKWLRDNDYYQFWPVQTGMGAATVDCLAWCKNRSGDCIALAIECKRPGVHKPTARQAAVLRAMHKHGVSTYIVTLQADGELLWLPAELHLCRL